MVGTKQYLFCAIIREVFLQGMKMEKKAVEGFLPRFRATLTTETALAALALTMIAVFHGVAHEDDVLAEHLASQADAAKIDIEDSIPFLVVDFKKGSG